MATDKRILYLLTTQYAIEHLFDSSTDDEDSDEDEECMGVLNSIVIERHPNVNHADFRNNRVAERKRQVICESLQTRMPVKAFRRRRV
jgi:hypothetical protein